MLAGLAAGIWNSTEEIGATWQVDRTFQPALDADERDRRYRGWLRAVERSRGWADQ
jgi:glycerol kinase